MAFGFDFFLSLVLTALAAASGRPLQRSRFEAMLLSLEQGGQGKEAFCAAGQIPECRLDTIGDSIAVIRAKDATGQTRGLSQTDNFGVFGARYDDTRYACKPWCRKAATGTAVHRAGHEKPGDKYVRFACGTPRLLWNHQWRCAHPKALEEKRGYWQLLRNQN